MSLEEFDALPSTLRVRLVCLRLNRPGFRVEKIIVVTTLLNANRYTANQLSVLYGLRWQAAEVNLRHLKTTLKMEMITAKTPSMVRKEIWTHLLAYTLLRTVMWQATVHSKHTPFHLSCPLYPAALESNIGIAGNGRRTPAATIIPIPVEAGSEQSAAAPTSSL